MATENTALRGHSPSGVRQSAHTYTLPVNPSVGELIVIGVCGYSDLDPGDPITAGDLTQSAGTAVMSTWQLHRTDKRDAGSVEMDTAVFSARVLTAGSLTVRINKAVGRYWTLGSAGYVGVWDDSRQVAVNGQPQAGPNVSAFTPVGCNANAGDVLAGVFTMDTLGTGTTTLGGTYSVAWSEPDGSQFAVGGMAVRIAATSLTGDAPVWTMSGGHATNAGGVSSMVVLREVADPTAPILSSPTGSATSIAAATVGATTDEANGTMYAVVDTVTTTPSATELEAGQDGDGGAAIWSGSQAISTTGAKTFNVTGLAPNTTYSYFIGHKDAAGNFSNIVGGTFTTYQRLAPISDVSPGGWVPSSGSDLFAMLDEAVENDTDFISTSIAGDLCVLALTVAVDPATGVNHLPAYRLIGDGTSGIEVTVRQGSTIIATFTHDPAPTSWTTYNQTLSNAEADAITDYSALRIGFREI